MPLNTPFLEIVNFIVFGVNIGLLAGYMTFHILQPGKQANRNEVINDT